LDANQGSKSKTVKAELSFEAETETG